MRQTSRFCISLCLSHNNTSTITIPKYGTCHVSLHYLLSIPQQLQPSTLMYKTDYIIMHNVCYLKTASLLPALATSIPVQAVASHSEGPRHILTDPPDPLLLNQMLAALINQPTEFLTGSRFRSESLENPSPFWLSQCSSTRAGQTRKTLLLKQKG